MSLNKVLLMLVYLGGLRVCDVVKLRIEDIDSKRKLIHVKSAKGRKDRYTILSNKALDCLRKYWKEHKPHNWLFPSEKNEGHITVRTAQRIFENTCKKANTRKKVSIYSLGHNFATHLLESGVDLRYIQELPGHAGSKITKIYTHVSSKNLGRIINPLDRLKID